MVEDHQKLKHGWVWIGFLLLFFCNAMPIFPAGFTLVLLCSPLWLYFLYLQKKLEVAFTLAIPLLVYIPIHLMQGVEMKSYFISFIYLAVLVCYSTSIYFLINRNEVNLDLIFKDTALLNFILFLISLGLLFIPSLKEMVWYMVPISENIDPIPRLKLFTAEASHYSFILSPLVIYFFAKSLFFKTKNTAIMLLVVSIPLLCSFSLGVLLVLVFTGLLLLMVYSKRIFRNPRKALMVMGFFVLCVLVFLVAYRWFPDNALFARIENIINGRDTSSRGRTYEAFMLSDKIAALKSSWWGIGEGQLKIIGREVVIKFYSYSKIPETVRIPNASAETIAYFGYIGFAIRMFLQIWLFFRTKVASNPYRFWLFAFVFVYQFTGSYITNAAEYLIWVLAFSNIFPEFVLQDKQAATSTTVTS